MYTALLPYQGKGKSLKVTDVLPFEWDEKSKISQAKKLTKAELLEAFRRQDEFEAKQLKNKQPIAIESPKL